MPFDFSLNCRFIIQLIRHADLATAWEAEVLFDIFIFSLTVLKSWKDRRIFPNGLTRTFANADGGLYGLICRDGELLGLSSKLVSTESHCDRWSILCVSALSLK